MLKTILGKLNGHAVEAPSLAEALAQLGRDRKATEADIDRLNRERKKLLLDDASDTALDKIERQLDRATVALEKLTVAEAPLRERLAVASAAERQRRWNALHEAHRAAAAEFLATARAAAAKHDALISVVEQARREGFEPEAQAHMPPPPSLHGNLLAAHDLLDLFERSLVPRTIAVESLAPRPAVRVPVPQPTLQHGVSLAPQEPQSWFAPRAADDDSPLEPGQARVVVLRSGYSADGVTLSHAGRKVRLPRETAMAAARAGAVEIIETGGHAQ